MSESTSIEDHPEWGDVLDEIKKYGNWTKGDLIEVVYDDSGEGETKKALANYSKGSLLALLIDGLHGGTCQ